jgi:hypothetical protein
LCYTREFNALGVLDFVSGSFLAPRRLARASGCEARF